MEPTLSIIIPTLHEERYLHRTLEALAKIKSITYEIIITDGKSGDMTIEIARKYTDKIVIWDKPHRQTFGEAKNAGAALARGKYYVFIDADVHIPEADEFFVELIGVFDRSPHMLALTLPQRVIPEFGRFLDNLWASPLNWWYRFENNVLGHGNASGEFQMIHAHAFHKVKGYRENLSAGEDNDMFRRLALHGKTHYYPHRAAYHTFRRPHKLGWIRTYAIWLTNGLYLALRGDSAFKEWKVVR